MENFEEFDQKGQPAGKSTGEIISHAFEIYKNNFGWGVLFFVILVIISTLVSSLLSVFTSYDPNAVSETMNEMIKTKDWDFNVLIGTPGFVENNLISYIVGLLLFPLYAGYIYISQKTNNGQKINFFSDILIGYRQNTGQFILYSLISGIVMGIALMMCVVPAIFVAPLFFIGLPILLFENTSATNAIGKSYKIATQNYGTFLGTAFLSFIIAMAGIFLCCVGIIFTYPFLIVAMYSAYTAFCGVPRIVNVNS